MSLDDAIRAAEEAATKLREAYEAVEREAAGIERLAHPVGMMGATVRAVTLEYVRRALADHRRPKGPPVTLEWSGDGATKVVEAVRRTETAVFVRNEHGTEERYSLKDGEPPGGKATRATRIRGFRTGTMRYRISKADLPTLRAMPIGENAVSRALKAIEAGKYDEVKR